MYPMGNIQNMIGLLHENRWLTTLICFLLPLYPYSCRYKAAWIIVVQQGTREGYSYSAHRSYSAHCASNF